MHICLKLYIFNLPINYAMNSSFQSKISYKWRHTNMYSTSRNTNQSNRAKSMDYRQFNPARNTRSPLDITTFNFYTYENRSLRSKFCTQITHNRCKTRLQNILKYAQNKQSASSLQSYLQVNPIRIKALPQIKKANVRRHSRNSRPPLYAFVPDSRLIKIELHHHPAVE
jgi:hypothetical protein